MKPKIIRPEGQELLDYLNEGYAICNNCGAVMDTKTISTVREDYICPACGWAVDSMDYEYDSDETEEWTSEMLKVFGEDIPPAGCIACGGPYPHCKSSCKLFDD